MYSSSSGGGGNIGGFTPQALYNIVEQAGINLTGTPRSVGISGGSGLSGLAGLTGIGINLMSSTNPATPSISSFSLSPALQTPQQHPQQIQTPQLSSLPQLTQQQQQQKQEQEQQTPQQQQLIQQPQYPISTIASSANVESEIIPNIEPQLQNVVATVNMGTPLDLKKIALQARNAEYNPKRFSAVIMRIRDPKTTALVFASGKMVCTGAKNEDECKLAARKYARIIQKIGFPAKFQEFKVQNIVGSCDVRFPIRLEGLAQVHAHFASYEPELFPGLVYRMVKPKVVLLIFVSGRIVLTGAKVREEIYEAFNKIYPILTEFRKT